MMHRVQRTTELTRKSGCFSQCVTIAVTLRSLQTTAWNYGKLYFCTIHVSKYAASFPRNI